MHICAYLYSYIYIQAKEAAAAAAAEENKKTQENAADAEVKGKEKENAAEAVRMVFFCPLSPAKEIMLSVKVSCAHTCTQTNCPSLNITPSEDKVSFTGNLFAFRKQFCFLYPFSKRMSV